MIKRILVALDPDDDTPVATRYAIRLAKRFDASLTGLAVVDMAGVSTQFGMGGVGTEYYGMELWESITDESRETAENLLDSFRQEADKAGVKYRKKKKEGASADRIIEEMKYHDLLVVGRDSHFFYTEPTRDTKTLAKIVKNGIAPTLVVTDEYRDVEKILIAFDGSEAAARSLKSFVHLLPYGKDLDMELLHVLESNRSEDKEKAEWVLSLAEDYLKSHNFNFVVKRILENGKPGESILERQKKTDPDLVLLGAHSVSAFRRMTFGSVTHEMITQTTTPLFLSH